MSAPIGGGGGGLGGSSGPISPEGGMPRPTPDMLKKPEISAEQAAAQAKAREIGELKKVAAETAITTPPITGNEPDGAVGELDKRFDAMPQGDLTANEVKKFVDQREAEFQQSQTPKSEPQGPLHNLPGTTGAPSRPADILREGGQSGFEPTAFAPKLAETGQSGLVDEQPIDTSDKTVAQAAAGREAPAQVSNEPLTLQTDRQDPTDMGGMNQTQSNEDASKKPVDTEDANNDQGSSRESVAPTPDRQPVPADVSRTERADAPRTPDDSHETQAAVQPPTMPPVSPDAAKAAEAQKAQERATYMNELIKADPEMAKILEDANISYDPKTGIDVEAALKQIPTDAKDRSIAQDRAVRRLQEVQGLALLHQGQQERDALLASGTDLTKGEGLEKLEKAEKQIRAGRGAEVTKRTREGIVADKSLQRAIRTSADPNIQRMLEAVGGRVEDIDAGEVIKYLEAKKYENLGEARTRDEDQKLHDKLKRLHYGILGEQAAEDIGKATTPEKRAEAGRQFKEAVTSEVSHIGKLKEWLGDRFSGLSRQNLQYIKREVKGLQGGIKQLEKQQSTTKDPKARAQLEESIKNLKAQRSKELWKLRGLGLTKFLLILFIINSLAFTVGPALVLPQAFKMAGKSQ